MANKIYYGDNLDVLIKHIENESVDLCYIDPPFNSKRNYNQIYDNVDDKDQAQELAFIDTWTWDNRAIDGLSEIQSGHNKNLTSQSIDLINGLVSVLGKGDLLAYLISMTLRIAEIHRVLKKTGCFYLHCDPNASHYLKLILDALFCKRGGEYVNEISWRRINAKSDYKQGAKNWGRVRDVILLYAKSSALKGRVFNQPFKAYSEEYLAKFYKYQDENDRRYALDNLAAPGAGSRGHPIYEFMGVTRYWRYNEEKMLRLLQEGRIIQTKPGTVPRYKRYLDEMSGVAICDDWDDIPSLQGKMKERLGYDTQKPEKLLERIIKTSSNEGDIVLDAFCGCGTTVAVAQKLNRQWIGIDITYRSISLILKRLQDNFGQDFTQNVIDKETQKIIPAKVEINGVPKDMESAIALANREDDRTRKEFEKWMILTFSNNYGIVNEVKGGDRGIDGLAYIPDRNEQGKEVNKKAFFSVKSSKTLPPSVVRDLNGAIERDGAACGFLLTLYPMPNLLKESKQYGVYHNNLVNKDYPKIQVVCVSDIFQGVRLELPNVVAVVKKAQRHGGEQKSLMNLFDNND